MQDNTDLIADLRLNHEYCPKEVILQAADALEAMQSEIEAVRKANLDCVDNFNALMKDYTDLQKELIEIEEREYKNKLIDDPCPGCMKGGVCRTPSCGRLKLPVNHPYRT